MRIRVRRIEHDLQRYNTLGDYIEEMGNVNFTISDLRNRDYEFLVTIHEIVEYYLAKRAGITEKQITEFDIKFENGHIDDSYKYKEPGDHPLSPYKEQHRTAENIERILAQVMDIDFNEYDKFLQDFCDRYTSTKFINKDEPSTS